VKPGLTGWEQVNGRNAVTAVVGHDCEIGSWAHLSVGVKLGGNVRVGDFSFIGMGAALLPGVEVGRRVIIGANAVVNDNIPDDVTAVGVPVRILEKQRRLDGSLQKIRR